MSSLPVNAKGVTTDEIWLGSICIQSGTHLGGTFYRMLLEWQEQQQQYHQQSRYNTYSNQCNVESISRFKS